MAFSAFLLIFQLGIAAPHFSCFPPLCATIPTCFSMTRATRSGSHGIGKLWRQATCSLHSAFFWQHSYLSFWPSTGANHSSSRCWVQPVKVREGAPFLRREGDHQGVTKSLLLHAEASFMWQSLQRKRMLMRTQRSQSSATVKTTPVFYLFSKRVKSTAVFLCIVILLNLFIYIFTFVRMKE